MKRYFLLYVYLIIKKGFDLMRDAGCNDYFFYHCNAEWMRTSDPFLEARAYLATKGLIQEEN